MTQNSDTVSLDEIAQQAVTWAIVNGLVMVLPNQEDQTKVTHAPCTLQPFPFPLQLFNQALDLAKPFNLLIDAISRDVDFLCSIHKEVVEVDPFTHSLLEIFDKVYKEGLVQTTFLGLHRSDYMLHSSDDKTPAQLRQIEINTIASAFGALSTKASQLHRFLFDKVKHGDPSKIPLSNSGTLMPAALAKAYQSNCIIPASTKEELGVIIFVVQPNERNIADQRLLELELWNSFRIRVIRMHLSEIGKSAKLDQDRNLIVFGKTAVVIYFRAGYTPRDYEVDSSNCWAARLMIERSTAIKCPSIGYHLAGTKKTQQMLCNHDVLRRFVDEKTAIQLSACFAPQFSLLEGENESTILKAVDKFSDFVLKPQREGGGNIIADELLRDTLKCPTQEIRKSYILMERIRPPILEGSIVRMNNLESGV